MGVVCGSTLPPQLSGSWVDLGHFQWGSRASICQVLSVRFPSGFQDVGTQASRPVILPGFLTYQVENTLWLASVKAMFCLVCQKTPLDGGPAGLGFGLLISFQHHFPSTALTAFEPISKFVPILSTSTQDAGSCTSESDLFRCRWELGVFFSVTMQ